MRVCMFHSNSVPSATPLHSSVTALSSPQYRVGDTVTMKLMMREKVTDCPAVGSMEPVLVP